MVTDDRGDRGHNTTTRWPSRRRVRQAALAVLVFGAAIGGFTDGGRAANADAAVLLQADVEAGELTYAVEGEDDKPDEPDQPPESEGEDDESGQPTPEPSSVPVIVWVGAGVVVVAAIIWGLTPRLVGQAHDQDPPGRSPPEGTPQ